MRSLGQIFIGCLIGGIGLAIWITNGQSTVAVAVGVCVTMLGAVLALIGLVNNHNDHTQRR
jgi:1,4-dihydroxy-2-naphthoate octaprenyltransferase